MCQRDLMDRHGEKGRGKPCGNKAEERQLGEGVTKKPRGLN